MSAKIVLTLSALVALAGCQTTPPWPEPERRAAEASGLSDAVVIRVEGAPDDEAASAPDALTLADALRLALTTHPDIQIAIARVRAAQADAHQERLLPNPVLSVALRFVEGGGSPVVEASLSAELLGLLQKPGRVRAADHRLRAAADDAVTAALDVAAEVQERFVVTQASESLVPLLDERRALTERLLAVAESRLKSGEGTRVDVTTLRAQDTQLTIERLAVEQELRESRLQLARLIGQPSSEAAWKLTPWESPALATDDEAAWIAAALEHRPEIQARMWELAALGVEVKLARWILTEGTEAGVEAERDDGEWSVGPSISSPLPIFDWGQARRELADARRIEAAHQLTQARRVAIEEVRRALVAYRASADAAQRVRNELVPLLEQRTRETESIYRAGQSDVLAFILAQQDLQEGRTRAIELNRRSAEAFVRLQRAVGGAAFAPTAATTQPSPTTSTAPSGQ